MKVNKKAAKGFASLSKAKQKRIVNLLSQKKKQVLKKRAEDSFYVFVTEVIINNRINEYIKSTDEYKIYCDKLQYGWDDEVNAIEIRYPREFLKSTIGTIYYSIWNILLNPNIKIQIDSMTRYLSSKNFVSVIKEIFEQNVLIRELWGDFVNDTNWTAYGFLVSKNTLRKQGQHEYTISSGGVDAASAGTHVDIWIMDDLYDKENSLNIDQVEKVVSYFKRSLPIIGGNKILLIGTLWHKRDLLERIANPITDEDKDLSSLFKVISKGYIYKGKNICPSLYTPTYIKRTSLGMGVVHFTRQYMNTWSDSLDKPFKQSLFDRNKMWFNIDELPKNRNVFIVIDPGFSAESKKRRSHTGIIIYAICPKGIYWIIECIKIKLEVGALINYMFKISSKYKPKCIGIESGAQQSILRPFMQMAYKIQGKRLRTFPLMTRNKSKSDRILGISPSLEDNIKLCRNTKNHTSKCDELVTELVDFTPYVTDYGIDLLDAFQYITQLVRVPKDIEPESEMPNFFDVPKVNEYDLFNDFSYGIE